MSPLLWVKPMAKFATKRNLRTITRSHATATKNLEGGLSFSWDDKTALWLKTACTLVGEPSFYKKIVESTGEIKGNFDSDIVDLAKKVSEKDPEYILKLASYARHDLHLRSVPMLLIGEASQLKPCRPYLTKWTPSIISRADEICELIAYVRNKFGRNAITSNNQLKKGIASSFARFNEYDFAKYNRKGSVKLKDALRICHPKHSELYKKIIDDTLETPDTWEVLISNPQSKGLKSKKEAWEYLIKENKLGYMATLRNLRNLIENEIDPKVLDKALKFISDPEAVKKSRQLPFRFLSAYRQIQEPRKVLDAIETALELSVKNIPRLDGTTYIAADVSGSMETSLSDKSSVTLEDVACLMAAMADKFCEDPIVSVFASEHKLAKLTSRSSILDNTEKLKAIQAGGSTNGYLAIEYLTDNKKKVDRIMVFTDMEMYNSNSYSDDQFVDAFKDYKHKINSKVKLYVFNLSAYGNVVVPQDEPNVCLVSGWSDGVFRLIEAFEKDKKTAVQDIEKLQPKPFKSHSPSECMRSEAIDSPDSS